MPVKDPRCVQLTVNRNAGQWLWRGALIAAVAAASAARAEMSVLECAGTEKLTYRAQHTKLPATLGLKGFAVDAEAKIVLQRLDDKWTVLDEHADVSDDQISARYSHDYPDGRIDIAFELDRATNSLVYFLDIDERPGEFFIAQCKAGLVNRG